jgi:hypothetical protein
MDYSFSASPPPEIEDNQSLSRLTKVRQGLNKEQLSAISENYAELEILRLESFDVNAA